MTKEEVIEGNVVIATYLGQHAYGNYFDVENHPYPDPSSFFDYAEDSLYHKENLNYNYHWDWLLDAIDKIHDSYPGFTYDADDIEVAFKQVVEFIKSLGENEIE